MMKIVIIQAQVKVGCNEENNIIKSERMIVGKRGDSTFAIGILAKQ